MKMINAKTQRRGGAKWFHLNSFVSLRLCAFALALVLRLLYVVSLDPLEAYNPAVGSDSAWYLTNAYALVAGQDRPNPVTGETTVTDVSRLSSPPLYFVFIGLPQVVLSPASAVIAIRVMQAVLSAAVTLFGAGLAYRLTGRESAGVIAAFALALHPALILESGQLLTETLYIFLVTGGLYFYVEAAAAERVRVRPLLLAAVLFGLAALTRAVFVAFPLLLAAHLWWTLHSPVAGSRQTSTTLFAQPPSGDENHALPSARDMRGRIIAIFLLTFAAVVLTWTAYSVIRWNRFVIAGEGLPAFLYIGAAGWDDPEAVDAQLAAQLGEENLEPTSEDFVEAAGQTILADPIRYVGRRVGELSEAMLQPHGTTLFGGESLRDLALRWLRDDRTLNGLLSLTQGDFFWYKLGLYLVHYVGLLAGLIGLWRCRRSPATAPMFAFILYTTLVHLALLALPRYLFPTMVIWWVFAAGAMSRKLKVQSKKAGAFGTIV
jgi:hypothetical protein